LAQLTTDVDVDEGQGGQQREAETKRQHDGMRERAGAMDVGDRHAQGGVRRTRRATCQSDDARADEAQKRHAAEGGENVDQR